MRLSLSEYQYVVWTNRYIRYQSFIRIYGKPPTEILGKMERQLPLTCSRSTRCLAELRECSVLCMAYYDCAPMSVAGHGYRCCHLREYASAPPLRPYNLPSADAI